MIAYLPELYPDELVYSWFARSLVHGGYLNHKTVLLELLNTRHNNPSKEFIGHLNPEAKAKIETVISMERLILEHTMFPQYARFVPAPQRRTALHQLAHDFCDVHHLFAVLPRGEQEQHLKFCPLCVREDREHYGETYWHRTHQIRSIGLCPRHGCRLENSIVPAKSEQFYTLSPAEFVVEDRSVVYERSPHPLRFAEYMERAFVAPMDFEMDVPLKAVLYQGLKRTKYLNPSGRFRYTKQLTEDLNTHFQKMGVAGIATMSQIQRELLGDRFDFSVACQLGFFLGMEVKELVSPTLTEKQLQEAQNSSHGRNRPSVPWSLYDEETAPALESLCQRVYNGTAVVRPERVSERLVYRELGLLGHQLENMPRCRRILEGYSEPYPESWARKLIWAYKKLMTERGEAPFYWSDIRALSGVKKNLPAITPYLTKHTDQTTAERIIELAEG